MENKKYIKHYCTCGATTYEGCSECLEEVRSEQPSKPSEEETVEQAAIRVSDRDGFVDGARFGFDFALSQSTSLKEEVREAKALLGFAKEIIDQMRSDKPDLNIQTSIAYFLSKHPN